MRANFFALPRMLPVRRVARRLIRLRAPARLIRRLRGLPDDPGRNEPRDGPFAGGVREPRRPRPPFMPPRAAAVALPADSAG